MFGQRLINPARDRLDVRVNREVPVVNQLKPPPYLIFVQDGRQSKLADDRLRVMLGYALNLAQEATAKTQDRLEAVLKPLNRAVPLQ